MPDMATQPLNGHHPDTIVLQRYGPGHGWPQRDTTGRDTSALNGAERPGTAVDTPGRWDTPGQPGTPPDGRGRHRARRVTAAVASHRGWLAAVPIVLVNAVATGAQLGFWRVHLPLLAEAVMVALALESIAVYLAWQAHLAQLADDSALRLRLAAYGFALVIGTLNYSHFMLPGWRPTVAAVTFGLMSAVSPWLWSIHSRRESRTALKARGLIEPHGVRLGMTRWLWHGYRSFRVMRWATWEGVNDPARAIALVYPHAVVAEQVTGGDSGGDKPADTVSPRPPAPDKPAVSVKRELTVKEEAALTGVDPRTVYRRRERARKAAKDRSTT